MANWVFINGEFVSRESAQLHYSDLAIQRGYGVFDFFKVINEHPVFLDEHLTRFYASAQQMRLPIRLSNLDLVSVIHLLIRKNNVRDCGIRLTLTGGNSPDGYQLSMPNLIIATQPLPDVNSHNTKGIRLISYHHQRQLPSVKTIDYLMAIYLQPLLAERNADDILYHQNGVISECPRANFFLVKSDGLIVTPCNNILKGITRMKILELSPAIREENITLDDVRQARAAFVTSTTKLVAAVTQVDQVVFPDRESPAVREIAENLQQLIKRSIAYC